MKIAIRYYTKSGNSKKLAEAIGEVVGVEAKDVSTPLNEKVDILFLGNAMYAAGIDDSVKIFIKENASHIGEIVNVSSAAIAKGTYKAVQKIADQYQVKMSKEEFYCKGSFGIMNKNRPNEEDLDKVKAFALNVLKKKEG